MVEKINRLIRAYFLTVIYSITLAVYPISTARSNGISLISDAETQNYIAEIVKPLFKAANINFDKNKIFIVNDNSLNAFVSDGNYLFVNTGTIINSDDTNELAGILAHETGHILGGHIVRQKLKMENMHYVMLGSLIAAGVAAASTGRGDAAMAVILGSHSSALNSMLNYQIQEERSADESAIKLLSKTKQSTNGLRRFMNKIRKRNALSGIEENIYFRTHPMTSERLNHFIEASKTNNYSSKSILDTKHSLVKAKLSAFLNNKDKVWREYPKSEISPSSQYAHSILYFLEGDLSKSFNILDGLIEQQPTNPYFRELKGQFLFESGRFKESILAYKKALEILPKNPLIQISLSQAIIESSSKNKELQEAINLLQQSLINFKTPMGWQLLSQAYNKIGNHNASLYAAAEFNYAIGNLQGALKHLENAKKSINNQSLYLKISDLEERIKIDMKERTSIK